MLRLGVDLGGTKIEAALVDDSGNCAVRRRMPTPEGYLHKLDAIADLVHAVEAEAGLKAPLPVGVGHPGSLNPRTGLMRNANSTALNGHPLDHDLARRLNRPVRCANDANCFALSEARDGAGAGARSVFGVIAGTGVGGGVVLNGALVSGADGNAGEWGHTALPYMSAEELAISPACYCGKSNCVEAWCSGPALSRDHQRHGGSPLTAQDIAQAAANGDTVCQASLDRHADRFARALSNVINILDPEIIVLGGGLSNLEGFAENLAGRLKDWAFTDDLVTHITTPMHGDSSGVRGAAWLWEAP
ncbi:ROK family protein [Oceanicaulis sp. LC35]|uniref:ROK family protein n=1 Tax=Oceanicaulis sp. LC35 TaxID=3349635 RepID=UPI003F829105